MIALPYHLLAVNEINETVNDALSDLHQAHSSQSVTTCRRSGRITETNDSAARTEWVGRTREER